MRLCLKVAYVGTTLYGWQIQAADQAMHTVQGLLEHALSRLAGSDIRVHGAGRTDAGVHAEAQICHCDFPDERYARLHDMRHSLNCLLPDAVRVYAVYHVADAFHSRFSPHKKTYRYQFWQDRSAIPPRLIPFVWQCGPLDREKMCGALKYLGGRQDYAFLANAGAERENTVRSLPEVALCEYSFKPDFLPMQVLEVTGTGFLKQMVRNMAGLLAEIGRGKIQAEDIPGFIAKGSRKDVPAPTAPAGGLTLKAIAYDEEWFPVSEVSLPRPDKYYCERFQ
ncbi:MAG: tRNA pseudouridine(38-40) synthase TruA [Desulfovibrionaceae bacterium]|nr:tRNA pseudouridine(38-40) synthase TruA [Desulfovibrionaceae bacterium]